MPRSDPRSTAELLRELIAKATKGPWSVTDQGDLARGYLESSMAVGDARLIATLVSAAEKLADVLEPYRPGAGPFKTPFCRECGNDSGTDHQERCTIAALDAAVRRGLEEGK